MLRNSLLVATLVSALSSCTVDPHKESQRTSNDAGDAALALTTPPSATTGSATLAMQADAEKLTIGGAAAAALFAALKTVGTRVDSSASDARVERDGRDISCVGTHVGEGDAVFSCAVAFTDGGKAGPVSADDVGGGETLTGDAQVTPIDATASRHGNAYVTVTGKAAETLFESLAAISEVRDDENGLTLASKAGSSLICVRSAAEGEDETTCSFDVTPEGALAPN